MGPGDEVITAANTDVATTIAVAHTGAQIVLADVDPRTIAIDSEHVAAKVTGQIRAIVPVHLFGHPIELDPIAEIAARYDLRVIEDAPLAVGAEHCGRKVGTLGTAGCSSFAPGKILGAYGDAGAVTTADLVLAERVRVLRYCGHDPSIVDGSGVSKLDGHWQVVAEGFNKRLDSLQAAILRAKLPTLEARIAARRRVAAQYDERLAGLAVVPPRVGDGQRHVHGADTILVEGRDTVRRRLVTADMEARICDAPPVHLQPVYRRLRLGPGSFPVAEAVADRMVSLPIFPEMRDDQIERVSDALTSCRPAARASD